MKVLFCNIAALKSNNSTAGKIRGCWDLKKKSNGFSKICTR